MNIKLLFLISILLLNEKLQGRFLLVKIEDQFDAKNGVNHGQLQTGRLSIRIIQKLDNKIINR